MNASGRRSRRAGFAPLLLGLALGSQAVTAAEKELHWTGLDIEARLESDGTLAISELQRMVFTGDWNGGERSFRLFPGQELTVERIVRIDPATGAERQLTRGGLDEVNHWNWTSSNVLRWRSRRPEDAEFDGTRLDYRLVYRLTGAFEQVGERRFELAHDFAFTDRAGVIEKIEVGLALAPEWRPVRPIPARWEGGPLPPGQGFVIPIEVELAPGVPVEVATHAAPPHLAAPVRWGALAIFLACVAWFLIRLILRDRGLGRFGSAASPAIDRAWLEANVFSLPPEVVGAAWDRRVGSAEVAALLARLTLEGKLASEVKAKGNLFFSRSDLHLRLLVPRTELTGYERALIDALFGTSDTTDTESLRRRYRSTGFDPVSKIRQGVERRLARVRGFNSGSPKPSWRPTALLLCGGFAALFLAFFLHTEERGLVIVTLFVLLAPWLLLGLPAAVKGQAKVDWPLGPSLAGLLSLVLLALALFFASGRVGASCIGLGGAVLLALGLARATFNLFATRESAESLARRRELIRARDFFRRELKRPAPQLEDAWFPYLLALGLAPKVDGWFRRFGGQAASGLPSYSSGSTSTAGSSSTGGGWSGGGGAFGGAGASASWGIAATAMSAGVAAPSSSGAGGGGGSSGGGSSGGGGGGGW